MCKGDWGKVKEEGKAKDVARRKLGEKGASQVTNGGTHTGRGQLCVELEPKALKAGTGPF